MSFREDSEALSAKCEVLQRENDAMRAEVGPLRETAREVERVRRHNRALRVRMEILRRKQASWILGGLGAGLIAGSIGAYALLWRSHDFEAARRRTELAELQQRHLALGEQLAQTRRALELERDSTPATVHVERTGTVRALHGDAPSVAVGDTCEVAVSVGHTTQYRCRVEVRCGGELLYGGGNYGYLDCAIVDEQPTTGRDAAGNDGDPMLLLDLPGDRVVVSDGPDRVYSVDIALAPQR